MSKSDCAFVSESGLAVLLDASSSIKYGDINFQKLEYILIIRIISIRKLCREKINSKELLKLKANMMKAIKDDVYNPGTIEYYRRPTEEERKEEVQNGLTITMPLQK
jgi:hypothetical protein